MREKSSISPASVIWLARLISVMFMNGMCEMEVKLDPIMFGVIIARRLWIGSTSPPSAIIEQIE